MTSVQKELDAALRILSAIPVNGDAVDFMAAAKQRLRRASELCASEPQEEGEQDG